MTSKALNSVSRRVRLGTVSLCFKIKNEKKVYSKNEVLIAEKSSV